MGHVTYESSSLALQILLARAKCWIARAYGAFEEHVFFGRCFSGTTIQIRPSYLFSFFSDSEGFVFFYSFATCID